MSQPQNLTFKVTRQDPELVAPARITPNGLKEVSGCDDMPLLRFQTPIIQLFRRSELSKGKDPAKVIREAISQALVYYYPFAGRLREVGIDKKICVDCTGEGVVFVEADADVGIDEFGDVLLPPFPGEKELVHSMSTPLFGSPLMHFQVTRLKCGGFILATLLNHVMADGTGLCQFMTAVSEMARGLLSPSILPVWHRHLLRARDPPRVMFEHPAFDQESDATTPFFKQGEEMAYNVFLFDSAAVSSLRDLVVPQVPNCTTFELITATLWRARTHSRQLDPTVDVRLMFAVNVRDKLNPPIPNGYYGNVLAIPAAMATAGELKARPTGHAVELVKKAKNEAVGDYLRSVIDLMALRGRPPFALGTNFLVTDLRRLGFHNVDYGWGKPAYGGPAKGHGDPIKILFNPIIPVKNNKCEHGIAVPMSLPEPAMNLFINELNIMMGRPSVDMIWKKAGTVPAFFRWARRLK